MRAGLFVLIAVIALVVVSGAGAKSPPLYRSCKHLNARYPHGLGRAHAHDRTSGAPVTSFFRSDRLYRLAMSYNRGLDRDHDGIACEKA